MATGFAPSELREMREALRAFQEVYVAYTRSPSAATKAASVRAMPEAEIALGAGGGGYTLVLARPRRANGVHARGVHRERHRWRVGHNNRPLDARRSPSGSARPTPGRTVTSPKGSPLCAARCAVPPGPEPREKTEGRALG